MHRGIFQQRIPKELACRSDEALGETQAKEAIEKVRTDLTDCLTVMFECIFFFALASSSSKHCLRILCMLYLHKQAFMAQLAP